MPQLDYYYATTAELDQQLALVVAAALSNAIELRGRASLVVSGGSTPLGFFQQLSQQQLPWQHVLITLADERWVEPSDSASNEHSVRRHLLQNHAAAARFAPLKTAQASAAAGADSCNAMLAGWPAFDAVVLGMGQDGHTASLFPHAQALKQGLDMQSGRHCIAVEPLSAPHQRLSLTLPRLLNTKLLIVHITGDDKRQLLRAAAKADPTTYPIAAVLQQNLVPVHTYWAPQA